MTKLKIIAVIFLTLVSFLLFQYFYSGNLTGLYPKTHFEILAHRGAHVMWEQGAYDRVTGCEATHIYKPTPQQTYIENTIESVAKAFEFGATIVEIDIRPSKDNILMINHEENLECKTDGHGKIYDYTAEELKKLDVGYGFTYDSGKTYPFRGKGVGKMPTLQEVLEKFPNKKFLIDHKDRSQKTARLLVDILKELPIEQQAKIYYWGSPEIYNYVKSELPNISRFLPTRPEMKNCLMPYILSAGILDFSEECKGLNIGLNKKYSKYFWGWPYNFLKKSQKNNNKVFLMVDNIEDVEYFENVPVDGIITDYIETIGPYYRNKLKE